MIPDRRELPDDPPPILGTWRRLYVAVVIYTFLVIAACYAFTRSFS